MSSDPPSLFDADETRDLAGVLDEIIPPSDDGRMPGAGALGLVSAIEDAVRRSPDLKPALDQGLAALRDLSTEAGSADFASLEREQRVDVLNRLATDQPAFLPGLVFHGYCAYYQHPQVLEALDLEARPPHPQGYAVEPMDESLLDAVRARPKLYREV